MTSLYDWLKEWWRASQVVTGVAPSHRTPPRRGRPLGGITDTDYLRWLLESRPWP
jgi:hypothetical protein